MKHVNLLRILLMSAWLLGGCSSKSNNDQLPSTSTPLFNGISTVESGLQITGSGLGAASFNNFSSNVGVTAVTGLTSALCDEHGRPQQPTSEGGGDMSQSDGRYPYVYTYCAMTVNDGDTVLGGFGLVKSLICALEKGGLQYDGVTRAITASLADTQCWPDGSPESGMDSITLSVTGTSPAAFNNHFQYGVVFTVNGLGLSFTLGANSTSTNFEFIAREEWSGTDAGNSNGDSGVMAGDFNISTGQIRFEKRDERIRTTCSASRCGWNRHTRLIATLQMSNGQPTGVNSLEYASSNADVSPTALGDSGSATTSGQLVTAKGSRSSEIKARLFTASNKTTTQLKAVSDWTETSNTACLKPSGIDDSGACSSESGINKFTTDTKFALYANSAHAAPATWISNFVGFNFSSVNLDVDTPY